MFVQPVINQALRWQRWFVNIHVNSRLPAHGHEPVRLSTGRYGGKPMIANQKVLGKEMGCRQVLSGEVAHHYGLVCTVHINGAVKALHESLHWIDIV